MEDFDRYVGFWVKDEPYIFYHGDSYEDSGREYLTKTPDLAKLYGDRKCSWASNYFSWSGLVSKASRMIHRPEFRCNGRTYYETSNKDSGDTKISLEITEPIDPDSRPFLPKALEIYNGVEFDMSSLICSQLGSENASKDWVEILNIMKRCGTLSDCDPCTKIGYKIAKSLIKIASLRIFADPEQSIMELPVNSLDAYNPDKKLGKFGMGFFSILYWLVGHPKRSLTLESFTKDAENHFYSYKVVLKETSGILTFALTTYPLSEVTTTGLKLTLVASSDPFTYENVVNFNKQIWKLFYISGASLFLSTTSIFTQASKNIGNDGKNPIFCEINTNGIVIEDYATGVPLEVLFGSLFVPSISTKTIAASETSRSFSNSSRAHKLTNGFDYSKIAILVGGIAVVYLQCQTREIGHRYDYLIELPSTTRLPVSRDDVIFTPETAKIFRESIDMVFRDISERENDVSKFQDGLQKYMDFTSNVENRLLVKRAINDHFERYKYNLVPSGFEKLYSSLRKETPGSSFVISNLYDVSAVEKWLDENIKSRKDVWYGMKVVLVDDLGQENVTDGGLVNYLFISRKYISKVGEETWIKNITSSYFKTKLYPYSSSYGEKEYAKYNKYRIGKVISLVEKGQKDSSPAFRELYKLNVGKFTAENSKTAKPSDLVDQNVLKFIFAVLSKYESLDVYFDMIKGSTGKPLDILQLNLYILYFCLPRNDFLTVLNEVLKKFSSFKGSQTYGASKNSLELIWICTSDITEFSDSALPDEKVNEYLLQHILCTIRATKEGPKTSFRFLNRNSPNALYLELSTNPAGKAFYREVAKQSTNFVEFTTILVGAGKCFMFGGTGSYLANLEGIPALVAHFIQEIRSRKYSISFVVESYETFENQGVADARFTKVVYLKDANIAKEWVKNMSNVSSIEKIKEFPKPEGDTLSLSSLVKKLFKTDIPEKDLSGFFKNVEAETGTPLQIIEIATNEGTTKPFIEATLTELVQNSIDAIREFNPVNKTIEINLNKTLDEQNLILTIRDFIGMNATAFVYVGIPFLSTKTPSELVTGEMGSGFFNSYRESTSVVINSSQGSVKRISYDVPVRNSSGRVIDISKTIKIVKTSEAATPTLTKPQPKTKEYYSSLNIGQLKMILKDRGLIVSGRKEDLISRLMADDKGGEGAPKVKKGFVRATDAKANAIPGYTDIIVTIPIKNKFDYVDYVSRAEYTVKSVLSLGVLPGDLTFNGKKIEMPKILACKVGYFELYYTDPDRSSIHESYLLTKGVPFAPLVPYFRDILPQRVLDIIDRNFIVNITHGGYTPVQTRTRITLAPQVVNDFKLVALYAVYLTMVREVAVGRLTYALPHIDSTASASQLLFQTAVLTTFSNLKDFDESTFLLYVNFLNQPTLANVINECIKVMGDRPYKVAFGDIQNVLGKMITTTDSKLKTNLFSIVERWLKPKNAGAKLVKTPKGGGKTPDQKDIPEPYFESIMNSFVDKYWSIAKSSNIKGYSGHFPKVRVVFSYKERTKKGFYDPQTKSVTINTYNWETGARKEFEEILKKGLTVDKIETTLKKNKIWNDYFGYQFPSSTIVHELEHARRGQSHSTSSLEGGGAHENITASLFPGDVVQSRSFDQSANVVYQKVLEGGFYEKFFSEI